MGLVWHIPTNQIIDPDKSTESVSHVPRLSEEPEFIMWQLFDNLQWICYFQDHRIFITSTAYVVWWWGQVVSENIVPGTCSVASATLLTFRRGFRTCTGRRQPLRP